MVDLAIFQGNFTTDLTLFQGNLGKPRAPSDSRLLLAHEVAVGEAGLYHGHDVVVGQAGV